jgi:hypothetical protein
VVAGTAIVVVLMVLGLFGVVHVSTSPSFPSPAMPQFSSPFVAPAADIRDGNGREITDPNMRAAIEAAIQSHSH